MAKKRGLASNRGLDALLGSIKKEKIIAENLVETPLRPDTTAEQAFQEDLFGTSSNAKLTSTKLASSNSATAKSAPEIQDIQNNDPVKKTKNSSLPLPKSVRTAKTQAETGIKVKAEKDELQAFNAIGNVSANELNLLHFDVKRLQRGKYQPRIELGEEALEELATSIRQHGVMQPIVIRPLAQNNGDITHEIIAGERRWRAAQIAGLSHIPAIIRPMSDDLAIALALIENIQREDLSIMEQAVALQRFHDEFSMSHAQIADVVGKARTTVSNLLRLNGLHEEVKNALNARQMDMGHARALLSLSKAQQPIIAKRIVNEQLTVRQAEQLVKDILHPQETKDTKELDYDRLRLNQQLSEQLGAVVKIKGSSVGKGSIEIFYHSDEELHALIEHLQQ